MLKFQETLPQMEYNSGRDQMRIPEYGRNIQKMIAHARTIADRDERTRAAQAIIRVMGQVNPYLRQQEDLNHKLWDHLFIIADFDLDVDSPYPIPQKEHFNQRPDKMPYSEGQIRLLHYGRIVEQMVRKVSEVTDDAARLLMGVEVANVMKRQYLMWNRDSVSDHMIVRDLIELSKGRIRLPIETELNKMHDVRPQQPLQNQGRSNSAHSSKKRNKRGNRNNKGRNPRF
jgi:hypothetical protein